MRRFLTAFLLLCAAIPASATPATIVVGARPSAMESLAARELQKYMHELTGERLPIATSASGDAFAVGTPASNPLVKACRPDVRALGDEGYILRTVPDSRRRVMLVTGRTPLAVLYAVYSLLEEYDCGFYLGGDTVPAPKPFRMIDLNVTKSPALKIRGVLPWYNFFNSPTTWDYEDYVWFFDQLVKSKNNFIGFHAYDGEPFCAYEENGKYAMGEPLASTEVPCWGTFPMKTSEFGFGTSKYFGTTWFGAKPSLYRNDRERSIRDSQDLLRRALDYGHSRGLKTCLGFEVSSLDPTNPDSVKVLEKRLRHLVAQYPMLDYVWIWEPESWGLGTDPQSLDSDMGAYYRRYDSKFGYLKDPRQRVEAIRMTAYAEQAYRILREAAPKVRLVVSGWGGDERLHSADFYPGMDKALPKDIIFASLDHINMRSRVDAGYELPKDRERWPIPWYECDGDQWMPQPNAKECLGSCRDALKKGCQGMLAIHWRSRDVEESHAMMSQFAWNPSLTYEGFYETYARKAYRTLGDSIATTLMELQSLGWRWVNGSGQVECGNFDWGTPGDPAKVKSLEEISERLRKARVQTDFCSATLSPARGDRLDYLIATVRWALLYDRAVRALGRDGDVAKLLRDSKGAKAAGDTARAAALAAEGLQRLADCRFDLAMDACASRVTNKGELGILATVNAKAYYAFRAVERELQELAGVTKSPAPSTQPQFTPSVVTPLLSPINPNDIWFAGESLPVKIVAHADGCSARIIWKQSGSAESHTVAMTKPAERYFEGSIPCPKTGAPTIEYTIELRDETGRIIAAWPHVVTIAPPVTPSTSAPTGPSQPASPKSVRVTRTAGGSILVEWTGPIGLYEVSRSEGKGEFRTIKTVGAKWMEDRDIRRGVEYGYRVRGAGSTGVGVTSSPIAWIGRVQMTTPEVKATPGPRRVRLRWQTSAFGVGGYALQSSRSVDGPWQDAEPSLVTPDFWSSVTTTVRCEPDEETYYRVTPIDRWGGRGTSSTPVKATATSASDLSTTLSVDFGSDLGTGRWERTPSVESVNGVQVGHFQDGNAVIFPNRPELDANSEITVSMWAKLVKPGAIPVLLCHGMYAADGYFVQSLGGALRFYVHGAGTLDCGYLTPGQWYHIACVYDGARLITYVNGRQAGAITATSHAAPTSRDLYIGRYDAHGQEWETDCMIGAVRIRPIALLPDEVAKEYAELADRFLK